MANERSKLLSFLLRHRSENAGLRLDRDGWCVIDELLEKTDFSRDELLEIVEQDEKRRYSISPDGMKVRANQGHSTKLVELKFAARVPPARLYHGTKQNCVENILKNGLLPMRRHYVHMSAEIETALAVGSRHRGDTAILEIDCVRAYKDGVMFYLSDNYVWLAKEVPAKYIRRITQ